MPARDNTHSAWPDNTPQQAGSPGPAERAADPVDCCSDYGRQAVTVDVARDPRGVVLVRVHGDIDMLGAPPLRDCLAEQLETCSGLVVDLDGVTFFGSSGLAVLVHTMHHAACRGVPWRVVAQSRLVTRPLSTTGLDEQLPMCISVDEALRAVAPTSAPAPQGAARR